MQTSRQQCGLPCMLSSPFALSSVEDITSARLLRSRPGDGLCKYFGYYSYHVLRGGTPRSCKRQNTAQEGRSRQEQDHGRQSVSPVGLRRSCRRASEKLGMGYHESPGEGGEQWTRRIRIGSTRLPRS